MIADSGQLNGHSRGHRSLAIATILCVTVFRLTYLFFFCPYDLAPDEAHYWDWSRHLDWSYYSKGPLIAWIIRAGCELFGDAALATDGTMMPAVRAPAVLCGSGLLTALYLLTWQTYRSDRIAFWVVVGALSLPAFTACSLVMTIDAPFLCCWAWALVFGRSALVDGKSWAWPVVGSFVALGILAKYTMALWLFSAGLFIAFTPTHRRFLSDWGFWIMVLVAGLSAIPILYWNIQHDWVTFRHVAVQAGVAPSKKSASVVWAGPSKFACGQLGLLLGYWLMVWVAAMVRYRPRTRTPMGLQYLWWMSIPTFTVFAASSLRANVQMNWPVAAYISGAVLAAGWLAETPTSRWERVLHWLLGLFLVLGFLISAVAHNTGIVTRLAGRFLPSESEAHPMPGRLVDPAARLKGWRYLGSQIDVMRSEIEQIEGTAPLLAGWRWDVPGALGFYAEGHPQAYSLGLILRTDRHSQYDLWHPNPADDAQAFAGKTFLVVLNCDPTPVPIPEFESIGPPREVVYRENDVVVAKWYVCICRGYRGNALNKSPGIGAGH